MLEASKLRSLPEAALRTRLGLAGLAAELATLAPAARADLVGERRGPAALARYLAYALPEREAVWWACMCVLHARPTDPAGSRVIEAARGWVRHPGEEGRGAILPLVREAGAASPAGLVGRAVFASRLADAASLRAGLSVAAAVAAAADLAGSAREAAFGRFNTSALDIARGGAGWIGGAAEAGTRAPAAAAATS